jgi:hypothetical protein
VTERLADLMRRAVDDLPVPPAPSADVLQHGRAVRRRRGLAAVGGAAAAVVVVAGIGIAATGGRDDGAGKDDPGPVASASGLSGAVFSIGTTVFLDGGVRSVTIDDKAIKSSYYTSAGLLVRHGNNNYSDGGGPQRFSLVRPDGTVSSVSVVTEETVPGVDGAQPYLAYTEVKDGEVQVVVHDVSNDTEVARVTLPGDFEWGGWSGPPVALSGDMVYVGTDDVVRTVDWRTGVIGQTDVLPPPGYLVEGGRTVGHAGDDSTVLDVTTGETLLSVPAGRHGYLTLSPDGEFATLDTGKSFDVYNVDSGTHVSFDGAAYDYGWTPEDDLARLDDHHVVTCSATSGECTTGSDTIPANGGGVAPRDVRFAGQTFES